LNNDSKVLEEDDRIFEYPISLVFETPFYSFKTKIFLINIWTSVLKCLIIEMKKILTDSLNYPVAIYICNVRSYKQYYVHNCKFEKNVLITFLNHPDSSRFVTGSSFTVCFTFTVWNISKSITFGRKKIDRRRKNNNKVTFSLTWIKTDCWNIS